MKKRWIFPILLLFVFGSCNAQKPVTRDIFIGTWYCSLYENIPESDTILLEKASVTSMHFGKWIFKDSNQFLCDYDGVDEHFSKTWRWDYSDTVRQLEILLNDTVRSTYCLLTFDENHLKLLMNKPTPK